MNVFFQLHFLPPFSLCSQGDYIYEFWFISLILKSTKEHLGSGKTALTAGSKSHVSFMYRKFLLYYAKSSFLEWPKRAINCHPSSLALNVLCLSQHDKRAPIRKMKWDGLCENKEMSLAPELRFGRRSFLKTRTPPNTTCMHQDSRVSVLHVSFSLLCYYTPLK